MNRTDIAEKVAEANPELSKLSVGRCIEKIQNKIIASLQQDGRVEIRGFGSFYISHYSSRTFRNPRTGQKLFVPAHAVPRFKPGLGLRHSVNNTDKAKQGEPR